MKFSLIGTAAAPGIPVYGCRCPACEVAKNNPNLARHKTSAMLECHGQRLLFDANADDFLTRFPQGSFDAICLTHFHMDHINALFDIRWGEGQPITVYKPNDTMGADDLFKHRGILNFTSLIEFEPLHWQSLKITPVPLTHSRPTFGYVVESKQVCLAYLTDSSWMPENTLDYLKTKNINQLYLDTSHAPTTSPPRNHHNVLQAKHVFELLNPQKMGLIHLTHDVLNWAEKNPSFFNERFYLAADNETLDESHLTK